MMGELLQIKAIICEKKLHFFIGVGPTSANKIPEHSKTSDSFLGNSSIASMFLAPKPFEEITNMIQGLKDFAPGHDDITAEASRLCLPPITSPLVYILNLYLLSQGFFLNANVMPMYKADDRMCFNIYRYVTCQRSLRKLCIIYWLASLKSIKVFLKINSESERNVQLTWLLLFS